MPEYAEDIIVSGKADFVGLARPLWADSEWANKAKEGRPEDIRPCIRCNEGCLQRRSFLGRALMCAVNPILGFEDDLAIRPAEQKKHVAVVGGGLIGTEIAVELARKGHQVTIIEMLDQIMNDCAITDILVYWDMIHENHIQVLAGHRFEEINQQSVLVSDRRDRMKNLPCDNVVVAVGLKSDHSLFEALENGPIPVTEIGDCERGRQDFRRDPQRV